MSAAPGALIDAALAPLSRFGGPGTVYRVPATGRATLVVDDHARSALTDNRPLGFAPSDTPFAHDLVLEVRNTARLVLTRPLEVHTLRLLDESRLSSLETTPSLTTGLTLTTTLLSVAADAVIDVVGRGFGGDCGPSDTSCGNGGHGPDNASGAGAQQYGGGSHGGLGAGASNPSYGEIANPTTAGSGGGYGFSGSFPGDDGGGRVRIMTQTLELAGRILANGSLGANPGVNGGGGGAGGSVWITTSVFSGGGSIHADGADSPNGLPGGGGRVALHYTSGTVDLSRFTARPGESGANVGTAGTVWVRRGAGPADLADLIIDDGGRGGGDGRALGFATSDGTQTLEARLVLGGRSQLALASPLAVRTLELRDRAVLTHVPTSPSYEGNLVVTADTLIVGPDARIDVSGRGHAGDCSPRDESCGNGGHGPGNASGAGGQQRSGGGHGGLGGGPTPSRTFGDPFAPITQGAGGGYGISGTDPGGHGGGRVRLIVGTLQLDGLLAADGVAGSANNRSGGGAGGSVYVTAQTLRGGGRISATGGQGGTFTLDGPPGGGGGGGGRVALAYTTNDGFDLTRIAAPGGAGVNPDHHGGPGTIWLDGPGQDRLLVDNAGRSNVNESAPWLEVGARPVATVTASGVTVSGDPWLAGSLAGLEVEVGETRFIVVDNGTNSLTLSPGSSLGAIAPGQILRGRRAFVGALELSSDARVALDDRLAIDDLLVAQGAVLTHPPTRANVPEYWLRLAVTNTVDIADGAAIDLTGRGYPGDCTTRDASCGNGGHGPNNQSGAGASQRAAGSHAGVGAGSGFNRPFGIPSAPVLSGAGGGYGATGGNPGGHGGGRLHLVAERLVVDGAVLATGGDAGLFNAAFDGGAGAGGSLWIEVETLGGAGRIDASGGGSSLAGGGGGRVALTWVEDLVGAPFDVDAITATGGAGQGGGGPGTLYLAKSGQQPRLVVDNGERAHVNETSPWVEVSTRTVSAVDGLTVTVGGSSPGWVPGDLVGAEVRFDAVGQPHRVVANTANTLTLHPDDGAPTVAVGSRVQGLRRFAGTLELHGAARVAMTDHYGGEDLTVSGATLTHPLIASDTGIFGLHLTLANRVTVTADGRIDVSARGFAGDCSPADSSCGNGGHGPDNASGAGGRQLSGGSFGGLGGGPNPNAVYGGPLDVFYPGSGGGYGASGTDHGGAGGGRILIHAGELLLDGELRADGARGLSNQAGGGAGGGIEVMVTTLSGGGSIWARGGDGATTGGGGGGGRVLVVGSGPAIPLEVGGGDSDTPANVGGVGTATRL